MALSPNEILSATRTVNEELLDQAIRHSHHLQRLSTHEVNEILGFLNTQVLPDTLDNLRRRLENISQRGFDTGPWTTSRVRNMLGSTNEIMQSGMREAGQQLRGDLRQFARTEAQWQVRSLSRSTGALEIGFQTPNVSQLNSILTSHPYQGAVFNDWWNNVSRSSQNIINQQIGIGLAEGETVDQMIRRLRGTVGARFRDGALERVRHNVAATVRTATNHVNTHAREMTYKENDEVIKGVQYVATLDGRTTAECMALDGKVFNVGEGPRPPQHYQCRSTTVPVLKSLEELGLPKLRKALPEGTRATKDVTRHIKKVMNGQVPARTTYGKWLKKQTNTVQNDILGLSRAKMFRSGQVVIDKFVDPRGRPMTLEQLRKREGMPPIKKPAPPRGPALEPIPDYVKQATGEEALEQLKEMLPGTTVRISEEAGMSDGSVILRTNTGALSDRGIKDRLNIASKDVARMRKEYPAFDGMVRAGKVLGSVDVTTGNTVALKGETVIGYYSGRSKSIVIGQSGEAGSGFLAIGRGRWTIGGKAFNTSFRHELAHALHQDLRRVAAHVHHHLINDWDDIYYNKRMLWWKSNVSRYSATNAKEAFAECFAAYTHPEYGVGGWRQRLPKDIEEFFGKLLK